MSEGDSLPVSKKIGWRIVDSEIGSKIYLSLLFRELSIKELMEVTGETKTNIHNYIHDFVEWKYANRVGIPDRCKGMRYSSSQKFYMANLKPILKFLKHKLKIADRDLKLIEEIFHEITRDNRDLIFKSVVSYINGKPKPITENPELYFKQDLTGSYETLNAETFISLFVAEIFQQICNLSQSETYRKSTYKSETVSIIPIPSKITKTLYKKYATKISKLHSLSNDINTHFAKNRYSNQNLAIEVFGAISKKHGFAKMRTTKIRGKL